MVDLIEKRQCRQHRASSQDKRGDPASPGNTAGFHQPGFFPAQPEQQPQCQASRENRNRRFPRGIVQGLGDFMVAKIRCRHPHKVQMLDGLVAAKFQVPLLFGYFRNR